MEHKKLILPAILLASLSACSDNNDSSNTSAAPTTPDTPTTPVKPDTPVAKTSMSVTAIDGYLRGADVWLDVNGNYIKDAGEPQAASGNRGVAELDTTNIAHPELYPVVVQATAGETVDEDDGQKITHDYIMSAPPGLGEKYVTPLTTLVQIYISQNTPKNATPEDIVTIKEQAISTVATSLGLKADDGLLGDFIAKSDGANAFAARSIVDSKSLSITGDDLLAIATNAETPEAQQITNYIAAVNEKIQTTINEKVTELNAGDISNVDFDKVPPIFDPIAEKVDDTDEDGVPDNLDAYPLDNIRYLPSDKLAYTSYYSGQEVKRSDDNLGTIKLDGNKHFTGTTDGNPVFFYTPLALDKEFRLSALADFSFKVSQFKGNAFTNIYVKPVNKTAYDRIKNVATASKGDPLRDTNWDENTPENDTYVFSIPNGDTLNAVIKRLNEDESVTISKADFTVLSFVDAPRGTVDNDPEVTNGNFILKLGDSTYTGSEAFTVDAYDMAKTYKIGNGPEIVIANAVDVQPQPTGDSPLVGKHYGKRVWMYPADLGGASVPAFGVLAPLSKFNDFSYATDIEDPNASVSVSVYVAAKDGVDETKFNPEYFKPVTWIKSKPDGKTIYDYVIQGHSGSLSSSLAKLGVKIDDLDLINYVDGPNDGDPAAVTNFILKIGGGDSDAHDFNVSKFTFIK